VHYGNAQQTAENLRVRSESQVQCSLVPELEEHPELLRESVNLLKGNSTNGIVGFDFDNF